MRYLMELFSFDFKHCSPNLIIHKPFFGRVFARYGRAGRFPVAVCLKNSVRQGTSYGIWADSPLPPAIFNAAGTAILQLCP